MKRTKKRNTIKRLSKKNKRKYLNGKNKSGGKTRNFLYSSLTVDDVKNIAIFFQGSILRTPFQLPNGLINYIIQKKGTDLATLVDTIKETMYLEKVGETYLIVFNHDKNILSKDQSAPALTISQTRIDSLGNGQEIHVLQVGDIITLGAHSAGLNEIEGIKKLLTDFMTVSGGVMEVNIDATILFMKEDTTNYKIMLQLKDTKRSTPEGKILVNLFEIRTNSNWVAQPEPFTADLHDKICNPLSTIHPLNSDSSYTWKQYLNEPSSLPSVMDIREKIQDKHFVGDDRVGKIMFSFEPYDLWEDISESKKTQLKDPKFGWRFVQMSQDQPDGYGRAMMCRDAEAGDTMGCGGLPGVRAATGSLATQNKIEKNPYNEDCNNQLCCIPGEALKPGWIWK